MSLLVSGNMRDEIDKALRAYVDGIKVRTKGNLTSEAVTAEGFFRNFLNLLYDFKLNKNEIESANNETIDLHSTESKICVQVSAQNTKQKVDSTVKAFVEKKKYEQYKELHFVILDREKSFNYDEDPLLQYEGKIVFHDLTTIFATLLNNFDSREKIEPIYKFIKSEFDENFQIKAPTLKVENVQSVEIEDLRKMHIVEQISTVLDQFEGFSTIYPRTIARLFPFNSTRRNFDPYSHHCLKTDNKEIHELLQKIEIDDKKEIVISDSTLEPFREKIKEIFTKLNYSLIRCICYREKYTEVEHHNINIIRYDPSCNCNNCKYSKFQIPELFSVIKEKFLTPSVEFSDAMKEGYYMAKLGEHVKSYQAFKIIESETSKNNKFISNFIANHNLKKIRNFIDVPWLEAESKAILPVIDNFDLHDKLSSSGISKDVKEELIRIKEDYYLNYSREEIEGLVKKINETYDFYKKSGIEHGSNHVQLLWEELQILHSFYTSNAILLDDFYSFQEAISKGIEGIFISYATNNRYPYKYKELDVYIFKLIIFYVKESKIELLLKNLEIDSLKTSGNNRNEIIKIIFNFFSSQIKIQSFGDIKYNDDLDKQEYFSHYRQNLRHYFNRIMLVLAKIKPEDDLKIIIDPIINYITGVKDIGNWDYFVQFFEKHSSIFNQPQLEKLIEQLFINWEHAISNENLKIICRLAGENTKFQISNNAISQKIYNSVLVRFNDNGRLHDKFNLISLYIISNEEYRKLIKNESVKYLNSNFNANYYQLACFYNIFNKDEYPDFLNSYLDYAEKQCTPFDYKQEGDKWIAQSFTGINCIICFKHLDIDFSHLRIQALSKKSDYYNWLINPKTFDYTKFNKSWLSSFMPVYIRKEIKAIEPLKNFVLCELEKKYDSELAKLLFINNN